MSFFRTILKIASLLQKKTKPVAQKKAPSTKKTTKPRIVRTSDFPTAVVGESHYQKAISTLHVTPVGQDFGTEIVVSLVCEDDNPYDDDAVAVKVASKKLGYLSSEDASHYREALEDECEGTPTLKVAAIIRGGATAQDGTQQLLGVWLAMDMPPEFA